MQARRLISTMPYTRFDNSSLAALEAFLDTLSRRPSFVEPPELPGFDASANRLQTESQSSALR